MATYRTFGKLDDVHVSDGDRGFQRMVGRVNPELLQAGNVYYSQNGRMDKDMCWRPRKGMAVFFKAQQIQTVDTTLPFNLDDNGTPPSLNDSAVTGVYGTTSFVDLSTEQEYFAIAVNNRVIVQALDGSGANYNIAYPNSEYVTSQANMVMANDKLILFRDGDTAFEFNTDLDSNIPITFAQRTSNVVTITTSVAHGLSNGDSVAIYNIVNVSGWGDGNYTVSGVPPSSTTFTVASTGANTGSEAQTGAVAVTNFFSLVPNGAYTAISVDTDVSMDVADGVCTVTATGHGRSTGDIVQVYASNLNELIIGDRYEIVVIDSNSYKFNANVPDGNNFVVTLGGKQPVSGGFIHMPDPPWGVYHEGRLIVPYRRSKTVGDNIDELVFSDIFDTNTYDPIINQLRFGSGSADKIIGVSPFISDRLMVFCQNSVHVVNGISGDLEDLTKFEVTREVGCVSRRSIVPVGNQVLWLSQQGIYSVSYGAELNLMSNSVPLSEPIEPWIRLINWENAYKAVGAYHDNRYFLAVPMGTSTTNNVILVYNFLNQGWESIDTMPDNFDIENMIPVRFRGRQELFVTNEVGGVHRYEFNVETDSFSLGAGSNQNAFIEGKMVTRRYTFNTFDTKKFARATTVCETIDDAFAEFAPSFITPSSIVNSGTVKITANIKEPDKTIQLGKKENPSGYSIGNLETPEDEIIKSKIDSRGYGLQFVYETSNVKIRSAIVDAFILGRNTVNRK